MRPSNPVLQDKAFQGLFADGARMTMKRTLAKAALLLCLALVTGGWSWYRFGLLVDDGGAAVAMAVTRPFAWGGVAVAIALALATASARHWSGISGPLYAMAEGLALGGISAAVESNYPGNVVQAMLLTVGVLAGMLLLYRTGAIKVTSGFRTGVILASSAVALVYVGDVGMRLFAGHALPYIHETGPLNLGASLLVAGLAALYLLLDFDLFRRSTRQAAPKYMEWYGAFALVITTMWLYLQLLRVLS